MASIHPGEQAESEPKKLRFHGPETTNATPSPPLNKNQSNTPTVLAIQYEAVNILALEYFPESNKKLKITNNNRTIYTVRNEFKCVQQWPGTPIYDSS